MSPIPLFMHQHPIPPRPSSSPKSWDDVSAELRMMLYDLIHRFRDEIKETVNLSFRE